MEIVVDIIVQYHKKLRNRFKRKSQETKNQMVKFMLYIFHNDLYYNEGACSTKISHLKQKYPILNI